MSKKQSILIIAIVVFLLIALGLISSFGLYKVDIYKDGNKRVLVRKIKNDNTYLNFIKPLAPSIIEVGDLIVYKDPLIFDTKFSKKENLYSRVIGMPGDIISINDTKVFVNNEAMDEDFDIWHKYRISTEDVEDFKSLLAEFDIEIIETLNKNKACHIVATQEEAERIQAETDIINIRKIIETSGKNNIEMFTKTPNGVLWNADNLGPVSVPEEDITVMLAPRNIGIYKILIEAHEENMLFFDVNKIEINGEVVSQYTIKQNYYFVLNDNRYNHIDSRTLGFIPEDQIVGKVIE